jgi:hypothetical protein
LFTILREILILLTCPLRFDNIINEIITQPAKFDLERMRNILKMKISEVIDKLEDDPHDTVSRICIGDFLYGDNTQKQVI